METVIVTLLNEHSRRILEDLQALGALTIQEAYPNRSLPPEQRTFNALSVDTRGFKFNREEANER